MKQPNPFKWRHFEAEIILLCVRWYLRYSLSYRDLEEMMRERGLQVDHTTIYRWVQRYAPELDKRCRPHLKACNDSWKVDETYIKIRKTWMYLYRAVDSQGNTPSVSLESDARCRGGQTLLPQSVALYGWFSSASASDRGAGSPAYG
jgi:transposase-like protein